MPDIIDLEFEKNRRHDRKIDRDIDANGALWDDIHLQLTAIMASSSGKTSMVSAALRAMLDVLENGYGLSRPDAKALIGRSLNAFFDE